MKQKLAHALAEHFDELQLRFSDPIDLAGLGEYEAFDTTLIHPQGRGHYRVGFSPTLTMSQYATAWTREQYINADRFLFMGPRITERSAQMFRQLGINYIDEAGNAYITFEGVHIDIRGRRAQSDMKEDGPPRSLRGGVNLFSTKRSQVIFAVLNWPELLGAPIRDLAHAAGVSLGQAQQTLELLEQYGFLDSDRRPVRTRLDALIDQWTAAYPTGLGSPEAAGRFSGDLSFDLSGAEPVYVGGEAAVPNLLRPSTLAIYTETFPTDLIRRNRWRRNEDNPNIFLRHQFWKSAHAEPPGVYQAPWLLVYADLATSADSRHREAAIQLRDERDRRPTS